MILLLLHLFFSNAHAINLLQESQTILCSNKNVKVLIDPRDRFIEVLNLHNGKKESYSSYEFLDSAILSKHPKNKSWAHLQLTPQNKAVVTIGSLANFHEANCKTQGPAKICNLSGVELSWSPTSLSLKAANNKIGPLEVSHYGVYPNDGTYFISQSDSINQGMALVDFGSDLSLIYGENYSLECTYL